MTGLTRSVRPRGDDTNAMTGPPGADCACEQPQSTPPDPLMASRRSRTTRPRFALVALALEAHQVPLAVGGNPTTFGLVARYVTGLIVLDARPT